MSDYLQIIYLWNLQVICKFQNRLCKTPVAGPESQAWNLSGDTLWSPFCWTAYFPGGISQRRGAILSFGINFVENCKEMKNIELDLPILVTSHQLGNQADLVFIVLDTVTQIKVVWSQSRT